MQTIDLDKALFNTLKDDYVRHKQKKHYQSQLQTGFDYMEAMIKLFGAISISVMKDIDEDLYKDIFTNNFKLSPSLGDFKSLATTPFSKNSKKIVENKKSNEIYKFLDNLFNKKISIDLTDINLLLEGEEKNKNIKSTIILLNEYVVGFRNKLKGHAASFKDEDEIQRNLILDSLDTVLKHLESNYENIINNFEFSLLDNKSRLTIKHIESSTKCDLIPIITYVECNKFSCKNNHKVKLFFYNDGKDSKSHYLDYSYNHYHQITSKNEIHESIKKLQEQVLHATSNKQRQSHLLSDFVGRQEELKLTQEHILNSINKKQASFLCVMGDPGIGKSAFLTQLQQNIIEDKDLKDKVNTYTFYAQKDKMGGYTEEDKYIWKHISSYCDKHGVNIKQEGEFNLTINLESLFLAYEESVNTKPFILIIDGLDEFASPDETIRKIPLNISNKIHIIYSSRPYTKIKKAISSKLSTSEHLNILQLDNIIKNGYSFILGKLKLGEVEELLSRVVSKDIPRESDDYNEIINTIVEQSESVPLYIYYITQELKEKNISDVSISEEIKSWAKKLPPKLANFYLERFKAINPLSRSILQMVFFSYSNVSKEDIYTILKACIPNEFKDESNTSIDEVSFIENYFNEIEVFLTIDSESKYTFYHLSVKEQLVEYLKDINQIITFNHEKLNSIMYQALIEYYADSIKDILYLKKNSDIYNLLVSLTQKINQEDTPSYYDNNYFHILNTLIWSNIYISMINHEDMKNEKYDSITNCTDLKKENINEVNNFYILFNNKDNKHLFEIRYAYELAFIAKDYKNVLHYKDMYEKFVQNFFLDIALNIDKPEYIQKFLKHINDWNEAISERVQDFIITIIDQQKRLDDSFYDILLLLSVNHKSKLSAKISTNKALEIVNSISDDKNKLEVLVNIVSKIDDLEKALEIANSIFDDSYKSKALENIALKTDDLDKALKIANGISSNFFKSRTLAAIASKTDDLDIALEIISGIFKDSYKLEAMVIIASKIDDLSKALEVANSIYDDEYKSRALATIASKTGDLDIALEIISGISKVSYKLEAMSAISSTTYYQELLDKALDIANGIPGNFLKSRALVAIVSKIDDLNKALDIADSISDDEYKSLALINIASKTDDLDKALEIAYSIPDDSYKSQALENIVSKIDDLEKALELANIIDNDQCKLEAMFAIASKTDDKELLDKALDIANGISRNFSKSEALINIASKTDDLDKALEIAYSIPDDSYKSQALENIVLKTDNQELLKKALEIANGISRNSFKSVDITFKTNYKSQVLAAIVSKTDDLEKALELVNSISDNEYKSRALVAIVSKTDDLSKALEIANRIYDDVYQSRALATIASKIDDLDIALEIANAIDNDHYKLEVLATIALKTDDLDKALEIVNGIHRNISKSQAMENIALKTDDLDKALKIANGISSNFFKSRTLAAIASKTDDLEKALEIAYSISDDSDKSKVLVNIISKTDDKELLDKALVSISNLSIKSKMIWEKSTKLKKQKYLLLCKLFNLDTTINETIYVLTILSPNDILDHYNVNYKDTNNEKSKLTILISDLIALSQREVDRKEKRKEFNKIKEEIMDNQNLLQDFISLYGKDLGIEDQDDFKDEFNLSLIINNMDFFKSVNI